MPKKSFIIEFETEEEQEQVLKLVGERALKDGLTNTFPYLQNHPAPPPPKPHWGKIIKYLLKQYAEGLDSQSQTSV